MVQPINYLAGIQQPNVQEQLLSGFKIAASLADIKKANEMQQKNEAFKADFSNMLKSPSWQNSMDLVAKYPEFADKIQAAKKLYSDEENRLDFDYAVKSFRAATTGNIDIAKKLTQERIDAKRNSGQSFEEDMQILKALDSNPNAAAGIIGAMGAAADPAKWESIAKAAQSQDLAKAQREKAEFDAQNAGQSIGLTKAQINKAMAETNKISTEAQKAKLELEAIKNGTVPDPNLEKRFANEKTIRGEYRGRVKSYDAARDAFSTIQASATDGTGASDIALITSFMKMLDPGSVVRETEFATAQNTSGLLTQLSNLAKKAKEGSFLSDEQRANFLNLAGKYYEAADSNEAKVRKQYENIVNQYGLDYENVFGIPKGQEPSGPPPAAAGGTPKGGGSMATPFAANPVVNIPAGTPVSNAMQKHFKQGG